MSSSIIAAMASLTSMQVWYDSAMGGCTNCSGASDCGDRKGSMLGTVHDWLARLYPTQTWGVLDDQLALESGVLEEDAMALAEELQGELKAATIFRRGSEEDLCDYIYVLCMGREPCAIQMRDGDVPISEELAPGDLISELYLRVALSSVAPLAVVQQVAVQLSQIDGKWVVREELAAGVYDAPLLRRMQRLVALLPAYGLTHVDMGEVSEPPVEFSHGDYAKKYGKDPHQVNYLFFCHPSTMAVTSTLR
jgi:hypothetical protein